MRKAVLLVIVLAIVLILSSCATLMSLLDMKSVDNYNKELMSLSDENKEIVKEIGLTEVAPAINPGLAVLVDAWALSPVMLFAVYGNKPELPVWASLLSLTGIFGAAPASLLCSGISFFNSLKSSPTVHIEQYKAKLLQQEKELEAKRLGEEARKLKEEARKKQIDSFRIALEADPTLSPLYVDRISIFRESHLYRIAITVQNRSPWRITAFKIKLRGWNAFGDSLWLGIGNQDFVGLAQNISIDPLETKTYTWSIYEDGIYRIEAEITQVMYFSGIQWPK